MDIIKAFLLPNLPDIKVMTGITKNAVANELTVPNKPIHSVEIS